MVMAASACFQNQTLAFCSEGRYVLQLSYEWLRVGTPINAPRMLDSYRQIVKTIPHVSNSMGEDVPAGRRDNTSTGTMVLC